ncbi:transmembrane protein 223 [Antennarius striatus]|uniref:transmembrane protein 223 n=1 Tax=Antennarius striatus TaxID=241820 RepID=UPI0035AE090C
MGLQRLLSGRLLCYSRQVRFGNIQQKVFQNATVAAQTPPSMYSKVNRVACAAGLCSKFFNHGIRQLTAHRSLCSSAHPSSDVTLFQHDRTRFFRLLAFFCGGQFVFWTYLGHFAFTQLRQTGGARGKGKAEAPTTTGLAGIWSFEMNLGTNSWRYGFALGCLTIGMGIVGLGVLFCRRSVSRIVLHRGRRMVTVSTQSPLGPGRGRTISVPLSQVAGYAHRNEAPSFVPIRIKGYKFYFLLDKEGTFNNAHLFDATVGAYRQF